MQSCHSCFRRNRRIVLDMVILVMFLVLLALAPLLGHDSRDGRDWQPTCPC